jgi:DNA-directed RNA polymerase alpha subunit
MVHQWIAGNWTTPIPAWLDGLDTRSANCVLQEGIGSVAELRAAILSQRFDIRVANAGKTVIARVHAWLASLPDSTS